MELKEGRQQFIHEWGLLGSQWGINRTMAQIHALLLISPRPLCQEMIMDELQVSRGNASMNIRALMDWGLVYRKMIPGERKDFFVAEKDMWVIVRQIVSHRKKKELDPMLRLMEDCTEVEGNCEDSQEFHRMVREISNFSKQVDQTLGMLVKTDSNWILKNLLRLSK